MVSESERVSELLAASLDPRRGKEAELRLREEQRSPKFSITLLQIIANNTTADTTRLAAALYFKNYLRREWTDIDGTHKLPQEIVVAIKGEIVGLMISVPPNLQSQLGEAVGVIAESDFWRDWDTLVEDLVSRLSAENISINNGVLQVAHSIFKRWRPLFRSDELYTEINHVLDKFGAPFLSLLERTDKMVDESRSSQKQLQNLFGTISLMMKLLYDLSCQDLPPIFEENMPALASLLQKYLLFDDESLHTNVDEESGPLELVKSGIMEVLKLWIQKYEDALQPHVELFLKSTWNLLTSTGLQTKFDILVSKSLQFLTSVAQIKLHANTFNSESAMSQVVENVVIPNLSLRDSDLELFEEEPIEFIRRDMEGSDSDTRRRAATDLLRALMTQYEALVTSVVQGYVAHYLNEYARAPQENWRSKDTAVYLFASVAAKGVATSREGFKMVNNQVDIVGFFKDNLAEDLVNDQGVEAILKVDAMKFLYVFRSQMGHDIWNGAFPLLVQHLKSTNYVVYSYAAVAIERTLALNDPTHQPLVDQSLVSSLAKDLLLHLFDLIERDAVQDTAQAATKIQENEFLMRCIMRTETSVKNELVPYAGLLLDRFVKIMDFVCTNPSNPRFCYYLFEAVGACIRFSDTSHVSEMENTLRPTFMAVLEHDIQDFTSYIFQLEAALIEKDLLRPLSTQTNALVPMILKVDFWLSKGNVPALVRLLCAMISCSASGFIRENQVESVLGIFKQLLSNKTNEIQAFELLECILANFPSSVLQNYYTSLFQMILVKLDNRKSESFNARFIRLFHFISAKEKDGLGTDFFIRTVEHIQSGIFVPLYLQIVLPGTPKLVRPMDRKIAAISLVRILTQSTAFAETYKKGWAFTCDCLLQILTTPPSILSKDDNFVENDVDDTSFGVGFTQLVMVKRPVLDYWPEITNIAAFVKNELNTADLQDGGRIRKIAQERLSQESQNFLATYLTA